MISSKLLIPILLTLAAVVPPRAVPDALALSQPANSSAFSLTSPAFAPGKTIPAQYTCDGSDISPPLSWRGSPRHAASFALIVDDPDAPAGVFTHWVLFNLPATIHALTQNQPGSDRLPDGALQGRNSFGQIGYGGPCPPSGQTHRYRFVLYALTHKLRLKSGASKQQLLNAMRGYVQAKAQLIGRYRRS